jgi:hypothetical protein
MKRVFAVLVPYSKEWPSRFNAVRAQLLRAFGPQRVVIEHIGSTAIPGLAKYEHELPMRRYFVRLAGGEPRVNLHAVVLGSTFWIEHLALPTFVQAGQGTVHQGGHRIVSQ